MLHWIEYQIAIDRDRIQHNARFDMAMSEKVKVNIQTPRSLYGSERYTLTVEVTNLTDDVLSNISVEAKNVPGTQLSFREEPSYSELSQLQREIQIFLEEVEDQLIESINNKKRNFIKAFQAEGCDTKKQKGIHEFSQFLKNIASKFKNFVRHRWLWGLLLGIAVLNFMMLIIITCVYMFLGIENTHPTFMRTLRALFVLSFMCLVVLTIIITTATMKSRLVAEKINPIPNYARKAFTVQTWEDLEWIEKIIFQFESENSLIREAFKIDKMKLKRLFEELKTKETLEAVTASSVNLYPGDTTSFSFHFVAPRLWKQRTFNIQFEVSFSKPAKGGEIENQLSARKSASGTLDFYASQISVPLGAIAGAICGFSLKIIFLDENIDSWLELLSLSHLKYLFGSIILGVLVAAINARSPNSQKMFNVENFGGGFIVGALSGLFGEELIEYLRNFLPHDGT